MRHALLSALLLVGPVPAALAADLSVGIGENFRRFEGGADLGPVDLSLGWTDRNGKGNLVDAGIGPSLSLGPLTVGVQAKGFFADTPHGGGDVAAGIGASASVGLIPQLLSAGVEVGYAPKELATGRMGDYRSATAKLTMNVLPFLAVEGGYRVEEVGVRDAKDADLAKGFFLGGALRF